MYCDVSGYEPASNRTASSLLVRGSGEVTPYRLGYIETSSNEDGIVPLRARGFWHMAARRIFGFGLVILVGVCLSPAGAIAADEEDVARAEREFELREKARGLYDRAEKRAKEAVRKSSAGEELRKKVMAALAECMAESEALEKAAEDRKRPGNERRALLDRSQRVLLSCPDRMGEASSGNDHLIAKLRDDFIAEEIERLSSVMDDEELALLESAVQSVARTPR